MVLYSCAEIASYLILRKPHRKKGGHDVEGCRQRTGQPISAGVFPVHTEMRENKEKERFQRIDIDWSRSEGDQKSES